MIWQAGRLVTGSQVGRRCHVLIWYQTGNLDCGRKTKINFSPKRKTTFSSSSFKVLEIMFKFDNLWLLGLHWDVCKHTVMRWKEVNGRIYFFLLLNHLIIIKIIIMNFTYLNPFRLFFYILLLSFRFFSSFVVLSRQLMRRSDHHWVSVHLTEGQHTLALNGRRVTLTTLPLETLTSCFLSLFSNDTSWMFRLAPPSPAWPFGGLENKLAEVRKKGLKSLR